jgi:hypothetical protein
MYIDYKFLCVGQVSLPPEGNTFVVIPGENVTIAWKLDVSVSDILGRAWTFLPKDNDTFARIIGDGNVVENPQYSPGPFTIKKPSTLILKKVTIQYNGRYRFFVSTLRTSGESEITVFVAGKCVLSLLFANFHTKCMHAHKDAERRINVKYPYNTVCIRQSKLIKYGALGHVKKE